MPSRYAPSDGTIDRARTLRREATVPERILWMRLRRSQLDGHKFRRQQRIGPFFADFVCQAVRLIVEVDGDRHAATRDYDARRTAYLVREGYRVLRIGNRDVLTNIDGVLGAIASALVPPPSRSAAPSGPLPLPLGERGQ